ncbi:sensor histidine kinase [Cellulomonas sp. Root137]|uniref:sensor histidine kinase n=1 Tax=Cellulomonas sp. Root137 TaxID=1736459 RepID=UPI0009E9F481|nr:histidine kinase [Cellulomonas sp. Root137]
MTTAAPTRVHLPRPVAPALGWRAWVTPAVFAAIVGAFLVITPNLVFLSMLEADGAWVVVASSLTVAAGATVVLGVLLARWSPGWATLLTVVPWVLVPTAGWFVYGWWLGTMAVAVVAAVDGLRRAVLPWAVAVAIAIYYCGSGAEAVLPIGLVNAGTGNGPGFQWVVFIAHVVMFTAAVGIAAAVGAERRARARHVAAQVTEQHALEVESLAGERARLARDLHDVVAHHVSLVAVRAESAPFVHPDLNDDARAVLAAIATDAREALSELRQVLVVLQRTSDEGERTPQPTACDVEDLVASAVAAGQPVDLDGEWREVPPATGYVLYRAVQEGLTNARRHAPGVTARLSRTQTDGAVGFRMTNPAERVAEPGRGLIGMRERVEALGGTMTAVVDDDEFVLEIRVPLVPR